MTKSPGKTDIVRFRRVSDLGNLEFLHATFVRHSFPRHTHETFAIGVVEGGMRTREMANPSAGTRRSAQSRRPLSIWMPIS
ncbi:MAG: AraC family ligand binding domain-containing protein [Thermodesulfobacteriota bacterium]